MSETLPYGGTYNAVCWLSLKWIGFTGRSHCLIAITSRFLRFFNHVKGQRAAFAALELGPAFLSALWRIGGLRVYGNWQS